MVDYHGEIAERVRGVFGDIAEKILKIEEQRLGLRPGRPISENDLQTLANDLKELSQRVAGAEMAERVYAAVLEIAKESPSAHKGGH
jgi:hypothetical protein